MVLRLWQRYSGVAAQAYRRTAVDLRVWARPHGMALQSDIGVVWLDTGSDGFWAFIFEGGSIQGALINYHKHAS